MLQDLTKNFQFEANAGISGTKMVSDMTLDLNTTPDTAGNVGGSGENCESQSKLNHIRGGGRETQDGK